MRTKGETALAVWCGLLLGTALGFIATGVGWRQGSLPVWTDAFYSGWAQTIGAIGAVYAAFRVGRNQVDAENRARAGERADEERLALHIGYAALTDCVSNVDTILKDENPGKRGRLQMLRDFESASIELRDLLRMRIPMEIRFKAMSAKYLVDKRLEVHRIFKGAFDPVEISDLTTDFPFFVELHDWFGAHMQAAEVAELRARRQHSAARATTLARAETTSNT
jgi:hypothetical protein